MCFICCHSTIKTYDQTNIFKIWVIESNIHLQVIAGCKMTRIFDVVSVGLQSGLTDVGKQTLFSYAWIHTDTWIQLWSQIDTAIVVLFPGSFGVLWKSVILTSINSSILLYKIRALEMFLYSFIFRKSKFPILSLSLSLNVCQFLKIFANMFIVIFLLFSKIRVLVKSVKGTISRNDFIDLFKTFIKNDSFYKIVFFKICSKQENTNWPRECL